MTGGEQQLVSATITQDGSLVYACELCGKTHQHGGADARIGGREHRVSHCSEAVGDDGVWLVVVADERDQVPA